MDDPFIHSTFPSTCGCRERGSIVRDAGPAGCGISPKVGRPAGHSFVRSFVRSVSCRSRALVGPAAGRFVAEFLRNRAAAASTPIEPESGERRKERREEEEKEEEERGKGSNEPIHYYTPVVPGWLAGWLASKWKSGGREEKGKEAAAEMSAGSQHKREESGRWDEEEKRRERERYCRCFQVASIGHLNRTCRCWLHMWHHVRVRWAPPL